MSTSLRRNAERLLQDVRDAHARLMATLDRTVGAAPETRTGERRSVRLDAPVGDDLDVPEFLPRSGRDR